RSRRGSRGPTSGARSDPRRRRVRAWLFRASPWAVPVRAWRKILFIPNVCVVPGIAKRHVPRARDARGRTSASWPVQHGEVAPLMSRVLALRQVSAAQGAKQDGGVKRGHDCLPSLVFAAVGKPAALAGLLNRVTR